MATSMPSPRSRAGSDPAGYAKSVRSVIDAYDLTQYDVAPLSIVLLSKNTGAKVTALQNLLTAAGNTVKVTGTFDAATTAAVKAFQKAKGLDVDGQAGPNTLTALMSSIGKGDDGVKAAALNALLAQAGYATDGGSTFGATTLASLNAFQTATGLEATGNGQRQDVVAAVHAPGDGTHAQARGHDDRRPGAGRNRWHLGPRQGGRGLPVVPRQRPDRLRHRRHLHPPARGRRSGGEGCHDRQPGDLHLCRTRLGCDGCNHPCHADQDAQAVDQRQRGRRKDPDRDCGHLGTSARERRLPVVPRKEADPGRDRRPRTRSQRPTTSRPSPFAPSARGWATTARARSPRPPRRSRRASSPPSAPRRSPGRPRSARR